MNKIMSFKEYMRNAVKQELAEQLSPRKNKKQQMIETFTKRIKSMAVNEVRKAKMLKEGKDYAKLQEVIWCDSNRCSNDEGMMDELNQMYENGDYQGMIDYLSQWDYGYENGGEYYDDIQEYDDVLKETDEYILVTVNPRHYWGDRPFGLYVKLSPEVWSNIEDKM